MHSKRRRFQLLIVFVALASGSTHAGESVRLPAGEFSNTETGSTAFSIPYPGLSKKQSGQSTDGFEKFNENWVVPPYPYGVWGLGPTFNEDRCGHCHINNGRGQTPARGELAERGMLVRISVPGQAAGGEPQPHTVYGHQIQTRGIEGRVPAEGQVRFDYTMRSVQLADGETVTLREPRISVESLQFGAFGEEVMISPRLAQQIVGLGLLEAVPGEDILEIAAGQPALGVSGRPNYVFDIETERTLLGRFGWKASQPSIRQQTAAAFIADIGATTYLFPQENCPKAQIECRNLPSAARCEGQGGCAHTHRPEVTPSRLSNITFYVQSLTVPARRNVDDPRVRDGERLFESIGCAACHVPALRTGEEAFMDAAAGLTIYPYTDLLLHDMGDELADGRPDFEADGREWRTPPLWGIGLLKTINGNGELLHDGRARDVVEAVLWHGGEAQPAREAFRKLSKNERASLRSFVESL